MAQPNQRFNVTRWSKSEPPNLSSVAKQFKAEGYTPYQWNITPNYIHPPRSDKQHKILQVAEGTVIATNLETNQTVTLRVGDRLEIAAGVRYSLKVGTKGATCLEAAVRPKQPTKTI